MSASQPPRAKRSVRAPPAFRPCLPPIDPVHPAYLAKRAHSCFGSLRREVCTPIESDLVDYGRPSAARFGSSKAPAPASGERGRPWRSCGSQRLLGPVTAGFPRPWKPATACAPPAKGAAAATQSNNHEGVPACFAGQRSVANRWGVPQQNLSQAMESRFGSVQMRMVHSKKSSSTSTRWTVRFT